MKKLLITSLLITSMNYSMEHEIDIESTQVKQLTITAPDETRICELVIAKYFHEHTTIVPHVEYYMRRRIREICDSPHEVEFASALRRVAHTQTIDNHQELHDLVLSATTEALKKQEQETNKRWTKKKSACCAGITGLISTIVTAGVTLAIHFTTQQCGN